MCGICGIVSLCKHEPVREDTLRLMCKELLHRGPDDEGVYARNGRLGIGLGHRRLSIIDLSIFGHQPMANEDKTVWIVFNGEVYNFKELRPGLESKGHKFISDTDTETVIHLYEEYGQECVKYLRGMFAFAIWDERKELLFLARDRVGKKPLLYSFRDGKFSFSSEFTSLFANGLVRKDINIEALNYYLTFGYVPSPMSIYQEVFKLPPAHTLLFKNGEIKIKRYWQLDYSNKLDISEREAIEETARLLKEAVRVRLYSDVPLGAFLSGGIDSSTVVALMSRLSETKVRTFSIGFEDDDYNELYYARNIANKFGTEHHEFMVRPDALEILPAIVERYGEPYADSSCIPTYYVARQTKEFVTVALNGDGGDELFAGYDRYQAMIAAEHLHKLPFFVKPAIKKLADLFPDSLDPKNKLRRIKRFIEGSMLPLDKRYVKWVGIFDSGLKNKVYSEDFKQKINDSDAFDYLGAFLKNNERFCLLDRLLDADVNTYLLNDLLVKVDIASMMNSLEARSPFLDQKLMEFAARLPVKYKINRGIKKYILKKTITDVIPAENIHRRKMGFGVPIGKWLRNELRDYLRDILLSAHSLKRGYFAPEALKGVVRAHLEGKKDYTFQLWSLLMLELWHKRFID